MNDEPVVTEFKRLLGKVRDLATEAERERLLTALDEARGEAAKNADYPLTASLRDCREAFLVSNVEPPPPEPMTVETLLSKMWDHCNAKTGWSVNFKPLEADLQRLVNSSVQAQARRDAEILAKAKTDAIGHGEYDAGPVGAILHDCRTAMLKSVGLE